jgi:hypothetical protein
MLLALEVCQSRGWQGVVEGREVPDVIVVVAVVP